MNQVLAPSQFSIIQLRASAYNAEDLCSIPGLGRSLGEGNGNPLQYSCLENPMDGGAWQTMVHRVTKSRTRLSDFTFTFLSISLGVMEQEVCFSQKASGSIQKHPDNHMQQSGCWA